MEEIYQFVLTRPNIYLCWQEIQKDPSPGKTVSNGRLVGFVTKHKYNGLVAVYAKPQLIQLCEAYGVPRISRLNKTSLAQRLESAIATNRGILVPAALDSRQYAVVSTEMDAASGVCLRFSSVSVQGNLPSQVHCFYLCQYTVQHKVFILIEILLLSHE